MTKDGAYKRFKEVLERNEKKSKKLTEEEMQKRREEQMQRIEERERMLEKYYSIGDVNAINEHLQKIDGTNKYLEAKRLLEKEEMLLLNLSKEGLADFSCDKEDNWIDKELDILKNILESGNSECIENFANNPAQVLRDKEHAISGYRIDIYSNRNDSIEDIKTFVNSLERFEKTVSDVRLNCSLSSIHDSANKASDYESKINNMKSILKSRDSIVEYYKRMEIKKIYQEAKMKWDKVSFFDKLTMKLKGKELVSLDSYMEMSLDNAKKELNLMTQDLNGRNKESGRSK